MRKRLREAVFLKENSDSCGAGGKRRRKLKASERLAQELERWEKTLDDAKRSYEEVIALKLRAESNCLIEFVKPLPQPQLSLDMPSSAIVKKKYLPLSMLSHAADSHPSPIEHTPIPECKSGVAVNEGENPVIGGFEKQYYQSPQTPFQGFETAEASQVLVSFMQRLTQHGVVLQLPTTPDFVKDTLMDCHNRATQEMGVMRSTRADLSSLKIIREGAAEVSMDLVSEKISSFKFREDKEVAVEANEGQLQNSSPLAPTQVEENPSLLVISQEEVNEMVLEKPLYLNTTRETEEVKDAEVDERQSGDVFFYLGRGENTGSESDVEDDDGLKDLWDAMEISLVCMNETKNSRVEADNTQNDSCIHDFYIRDDMGLVCSKCGLIGQDTEHIFNYVWGEKLNKRHGEKDLGATKRVRKQAVGEERSDEVESCVCKQTVKVLALHPGYKDKLRTHQEEGLRFLEQNLVRDEPSGCILAHAPGTGKSFTVIAFLQSFQTAYPEEKPVIIAPKGMLSVWVREFHKWKVDETVIFNLQEAKSVEGEDYSNTDAFGHQLKRHRQLQMLLQWKAQKKSVLMVGYSAFSTLTGDKDAAAFPEIKKLLVEAPGILVLDEGHFPRNKKAQIAQSLSQVHTKRRVLLSGTLFQNNFDELYNLYHLVKPDFMSSNASCTKSLLEKFMKAKSFPANGGITPAKSPRKKLGREAVELDIFKDLGETIRSGEEEEKKQAISDLRQLSEPFVHWYKGQILADLPGLIDLTLYLKLTEKQQTLLLSLPPKAEKQLDFFTKSMRVGIHPVLLKVDGDAAARSSGGLPWNESEEDPRSSSKIMFILDLLQLAVRMKEKVVLFSKYLDPFDLLERLLKRTWGWHLNRDILKIEGRTSPEERESTIDRFNEDPKAKILLASIKTCGEGVSLVGASRIVLLDVQWNPMVSRQAISRAFRIGQRKKVFVYRLVGEGTKEEEAHLKACEKEWLAKQIFEDCNDGDYAKYCHEVIPKEVDVYFESEHLGENVLRCFRYHFV